VLVYFLTTPTLLLVVAAGVPTTVVAPNILPAVVGRAATVALAGLR
jgi:hypothetical protein